MPTPADKIQLWQHFVSTAGDDKNRMISITTWLLTISGGIVAIVLTPTVDANAEVDPNKRYALSILGVLVSCFAVYIVSLYRAHEEWNRGKAECVAKQEPALKDLLPPGDRPKGGARVFGFFRGLAFGSLAVHIIIILMIFTKVA